jgi:glycosyltransferase involved in cell wall biosynthesis
VVAGRSAQGPLAEDLDMPPRLKQIVIFRPGVSKRRTAFENLLLLYRAVARQSGASIRLVVDEGEAFSDSVLEVTTIPPQVWQPWRGRFIYPSRSTRRKKIESVLDGADLVVTCDPLVYLQAELGVEAGQKVGARVWVEATVTLMTEPSQSRWPHSLLNRRRRILAAIERIVVPSAKVMERFAHYHLGDAATMSKFQVVGHPVDTSRFHPVPTARPRQNILCVSRLIPEKGVAYIIKGFQEVLSRRPDARLLIVGEGPMYDYLAKLCRSESFNSSVEFYPNVPHEQLPAIYQAADVFINHALSTPWWEEYFGVANLEAMACGLPIIITRSGAIPSVLSNRGKVLWTEERHVSGIAQQMLASLDLPVATESSWVQDGFQYIQERYAPDSCAQRWLEDAGHRAPLSEVST